VALWGARATGAAVALLFLDLDGFKAVNDSVGHLAGDELLVATGKRLKERLRRSDLLGRLGGDEFLVVLSGLTAATARTEADTVAAQLAAAVAAPVQLGEQSVQVGVSVGVSVFPDDGPGFAALLQAADRRMYTAKHADRAPAPSREQGAAGGPSV
jgi:diguanylate cyclase (GGDEF)-like protein